MQFSEQQLRDLCDLVTRGMDDLDHYLSAGDLSGDGYEEAEIEEMKALQARAPALQSLLISVDPGEESKTPTPGPVNWGLLRAHGVHVEWSAPAWWVYFTDRFGRKYRAGTIYDGIFHHPGSVQLPWPDGLRGEIERLAATMAPVVYCDVHNLAERTEQQVFDYIALRLLMQGEKSVNQDGECQLRGSSNGLKCAVGWLIPDDMYRPWMDDSPDGKGPTDIVKERCSALSQFRETLLDDLRQVHDNSPPSEWLDDLNYLAEQGNLDPFPRTFDHAMDPVGGDA